MHYAIVTETYPPEINGVALTVLELELGLRARGHDIAVVRPRKAREHGAGHELLVPSLPLPRYPGLRVGLPATRRLLGRWRTQRPDAVYVATEGPLGWSAVRAARRLGIPVATGFHTRFDHYARDYGLAFLAPLVLDRLRRFHNRTDATVVPTRELVAQLQAQGFDRVRRVPRAVDCERFQPDRRDGALRSGWGLADGGLAAIHVGRIAPEKNLDLAVRAYRNLQRTLRQLGRPDPRFIWVGDGPSRAALQRANPDFTFCGTQRGDALARHFASGDLFLFPSRSETFGNVTLEAMASGVPTIAFDYGAAREHLRDAQHGATLALGDESGFIEAATRIAVDDRLRQNMAAAGREALTCLHPLQVASDFDALLSGLAQRRLDESLVLA